MLKRSLDLLLAGTALLLFLPFGLLIALVAKFSGDGEIFYRQERLGRGLKPFGMLKFASMRKGSDTVGTGIVTLRNDSRVYPFGKFLRRIKLNEVPQLLNVLAGQMSLVGPRPMVARELDYLSMEINHRVYSVLPGVTGLGSLVFRDEEQIMSATTKDVHACYREDIAPLKADLEIWYAQHHTLWLDLRLMFLTAWVIVFPRSRAYGRLMGKDWPAFKERIDALFRSVGLTA